MGIFDKLFGQNDREITSRDLRVALLGVKRDRKKNQLELRKLGMRQGDLLQKLKRARKEGNAPDVDLYYDELQGLKYEQSLARRDAKVRNLETIALTRYIRGVERLEKTSNTGRIRSLMEKVQASGLDEMLRGGEVDEAAYLDMLNAHMDEIGIEMQEMDLGIDEDPDKEKFLSDLDAIISAEEEGNIDAALAREEQLKKEMEKDQPETEGKI